MTKSGQSTQISYRLDTDTVEQVRALMRASRRTQTDELTAANHVYLALVDLAMLKAKAVSGDSPDLRDYLGEDYALKKQAMESLLPALPEEVVAAFEKDLGRPLEGTVQDFERLMLWLLNVDTASRFQWREVADLEGHTFPVDSEEG